MFTKIFGVGNKQVLLALTDEDEPTIRIYFRPEGLGVCNIGIGFKQKADALEKAQGAFETLAADAVKVHKLIGEALRSMPASALESCAEDACMEDMAPFAKLFGEGENQVLAVQVLEDDVEIQFFKTTPKGMQHTASVVFKDTEEGWDAADACLAKLNEATARILMDSPTLNPAEDVAHAS